MADSVQMKLVVLYEEELRKASKLLDQLFNLPDETTDDDWRAAYGAAIKACRVALYHPALLEDTSVVMLTAGDPFARKARK